MAVPTRPAPAPTRSPSPTAAPPSPMPAPRRAASTQLPADHHQHRHPQHQSGNPGLQKHQRKRHTCLHCPRRLPTHPQRSAQRECRPGRPVMRRDRPRAGVAAVAAPPSSADPSLPERLPEGRSRSPVGSACKKLSHRLPNQAHGSAQIGYACHGAGGLPGAISWIVGAQSPPFDLPGMERVAVGATAHTAPVRGQACSCPWRA